MKNFFKIVLLGILTLSLINISDTKINYLNNNNEIEKVKETKKNANGDVNSIQNLTDLSYTKWEQTGLVASTINYTCIFNSSSNTKIKICDLIEAVDKISIREVYSIVEESDSNKTNMFGVNIDNDNKTIRSILGSPKNSNVRNNYILFQKNIIKFYDMSTFINSINNENDINIFLNVLKSTFRLVEEKAFIQVNDNITNNREELDKNFKQISIKGLSDNFSLNEKINISYLLENQNINEIEISLVYNDLPTTIYNEFNIIYPDRKSTRLNSSHTS